MKNLFFFFLGIALFSCTREEQLPSAPPSLTEPNNIVNDREVCQCSIRVNSVPPALGSFKGIWAVDGASGIYNYWAGDMVSDCNLELYMPQIRTGVWYEFNLPKPLSYRVSFVWAAPCGTPSSGTSSVTIKCGSSSATWNLSTASSNPTYAYFNISSSCGIDVFE